MDGTNSSKLSVQQKHSKGKNKKPLKVVYISNPKRVEASAEQFRAIVQKLTGVDSDVSDLSHLPEVDSPSSSAAAAAGDPPPPTRDVAGREKAVVQQQQQTSTEGGGAAAFDYGAFATPAIEYGNSVMYEFATHAAGFHGHDIHNDWSG